jgi:hypothetical protein
LHPLILIAFKGHFNDSFGETFEERREWCIRLLETGAKGVFDCKTNMATNLCDNYLN